MRVPGLDIATEKTYFKDKGLKGENEGVERIEVDLSKEGIKGVRIVFMKSVSLVKVENLINDKYGKWLVEDSKHPPYLSWRVVPEKILINLSRSERGRVQLLYIPFKEKGEVLQHVIKNKRKGDGN